MNKTTLMEVGYSRSKALVKATAVAALLLANPVAAMASDGAAGKLNVQSVQQGSLKVSGVVKDVDGEPIIGASIFEKGTKNGTVTDVNGRDRGIINILCADKLFNNPTMYSTFMLWMLTRLYAG